MFHRILVPTDGSELSREAAERAVALARLANASIVALYVKPLGQSENYGDFVQPAALDRLSSDAGGKAKDYLGFVRKLCKDPQIECSALTASGGNAWEAIVRTAEEQHCDLIFMAKHSRTALSAVLIGSQTYRVLANSNIPVLVYRSSASDAEHHRKTAKDKEHRKK